MFQGSLREALLLLCALACSMPVGYGAEPAGTAPSGVAAGAVAGVTTSATTAAAGAATGAAAATAPTAKAPAPPGAVVERTDTSTTVTVAPAAPVAKTQTTTKQTSTAETKKVSTAGSAKKIQTKKTQSVKTGAAKTETTKPPVDKAAINTAVALASPSWHQGIKTPYRSWIPVAKPNVVLLCVHGLGFSSASYSQFGRVMAGRGMAVYALDVRGFGQWMKRIGEPDLDFEGCLADVESALTALHKAYPGVPVVLVGESMGGAIAMAATARHPGLVDALISSVPSSDRFSKFGSVLMVATHYLENSKKPIDLTPVVVDRITQDPDLRAKMLSEPLNRMALSARDLKAFNTFMKGNMDNAHLIQKTPVLMLTGFKDKLVKPEGTIDLFNNLSTSDKLMMIVGDGEHLLLEENQLINQTATIITDWILSECSHQAPPSPVSPSAPAPVSPASQK